MLVLAHLGPCRAPEVASTIGIAGVVGVVAFRPWRRATRRDRLNALVMPLLLAAIVTGGACASKSKTSTRRPTTPARIAVESPTPNEITGPNITLRVRLTGGEVVQRTTGKLTPTEGHIHVMLDDRLVSMAYQSTQDLRDLTPGTHTIRAEFVAIDHAPFKNRPVAAVLFSVRTP